MRNFFARLKRPTPLWNPTTITFALASLIVLISIASAGGDPLVLARLGTFYAQGDPNGTKGYDGQFVYYISRDPNPESVARHLDVPAYRYQRILLPLLGRGIALGNALAIPWALVFLGVLSQAAGTWAVGEILAGWGVSRWYALIYGLWAGFLLALVVDLPEPLAYGLVAGAGLALQRKRRTLAYVLFGLAAFAKEVTLIFVAAVVLADLLQGRWRPALALSLIAVAPFLLFQLWLWKVFGQPGIGSGGDMATPFEWVPFMGLLRIGAYSPAYLMAMLVVFGPTIALPAIWGVWKPARFWLAGERNMVGLALLLNSLVIVFMPFSSFRETGGLLRFACGLVLAVIWFAAYYRQHSMFSTARVLNYCWFWLVLNVFLLKS